MSDLTKPVTINDLTAKRQKSNPLANKVDKRFVADVETVQHLGHKYRYLQQLTKQVRQALLGIFPQETLDTCQVVNASSTQLTISFGSPTVVNHARYVIMNCVQALHAHDQQFCQLQHIKVILAPNMTQSDARQNNSKRALSENTRRIIADSTRFVTKNERLKQALLKLADHTD